MGSRSRCVTAFVLGVALVAGCSSTPNSESSSNASSTTTDSSSSDPTAPDFYLDPAPDDAQPGQLLKSEEISDPSAFVGSRELSASRFTYAVPDNNGVPISSSAILFVPTGVAPEGGWPLLTYAHPTVGLGDKCAPSVVGGGSTEASAALARVLNVAVVATDYRGLGTPGVHPYLVGIAAGDDVLLAARAARTLLADAAQATSPTLLIVGGSQGAHAALWAAARAPETAPEFTIVGTLAQAPPTDIAKLYPNLEGLEKALGVAAVFGAAAYDSSLDPSQVVSGEVIDLRETIETGCLADLVSVAVLDPNSLFTENPNTVEPWKTAIESLTAPAPIGPVLVQLGSADTLILQSLAEEWIADQCGAGAKIATEVVANAGHDSLLADPNRLIDAVRAVQAGELKVCNP